MQRNFFHGGITTYNLGQKVRHLNVEPIHSEKVDCISEKVARTMAAQVSKMFLSDYGIGITGYATKVPGKENVFAFVSIAHKEKELINSRLTSDKLETYDVQVDYTRQVIEIFYNLIAGKK